MQFRRVFGQSVPSLAKSKSFRFVDCNTLRLNEKENLALRLSTPGLEASHHSYGVIRANLEGVGRQSTSQSDTPRRAALTRSCPIGSSILDPSRHSYTPSLTISQLAFPSRDRHLHQLELSSLLPNVEDSSPHNPKLEANLKHRRANARCFPYLFDEHFSLFNRKSGS